MDPEQLAELERQLLILSVDSPEQVTQALDLLEASGNPEAVAFRQRVDNRRELISRVKSNLGVISDTLASAGSDALGFPSTVYNTAKDNIEGTQELLSRDFGPLQPIVDGVGAGAQALYETPLVQDTLGFPSTVYNTARDNVQGIDELLFPEAAARRFVEEAQQAQVDTLLPPSSARFPDTMAIQQQAAAAAQGAIPPAPLDPSVLSPIAMQQEVDALNTLAEMRAQEERFNQAELARQQLILGQAQSAGFNASVQDNQRRALEGLLLQQVPTAPSTNAALSQAAQFSQTPAITAAPANIATSLPTAQALAPQVELPDLTQATKTNLNQRARVDRINQQNEDALREQQLRQLELQMQQFSQNVAAPILRRPR